MTDFQPWPKIPRWHKDTIVTEKIDGTNACVVVPDDYLDGGSTSPLVCQSRTRIITPADDNFGFARWVADNAGAIARVLGPGRHFGEWWGVGIQRGYGLRERRFTPFALRGELADRSREVWPGLGIWTLPVLAIDADPDSAITMGVSRLATYGSAAADGFRPPEGVVVFHAAARQMFKVILRPDGTVDDQAKGAAA